MATGLMTERGVMMRKSMVTLLLLATPVLCSAQIYKWVDDKGQIGFSDDLGNVPQKYRSKAVITDGKEQAVEIVEKTKEETASRSAAAANEEPKSEPSAKAAPEKTKPLFGGKDGNSWKQDFSRVNFELSSLQEQAVGMRDRMADGSKMTRGEYLTLQNTARDLDARIARAKKKLDDLTEAADSAGVPAEFR